MPTDGSHARRSPLRRRVLPLPILPLSFPKPPLPGPVLPLPISLLLLCAALLSFAALLLPPRAAASEADVTGWMLRGPLPEPSTTPTPTPVETPTPTLTATPEPSPTPYVWIDPLIVDNLDADFTGEWLTGSSSPDKWSTDYRFTHAGDGSARAIFRPTLPVSGPYEVFEWHPQGANRTAAAEIVVHHADGDTTLTLSQKTQGGTWISLGVHTLSAGTECHAMITNRFSDSDVVMADAFKFAFQNTAPSPTPTATPPPSPTPQGTARPFGEYVQAVIDELETRKATDVSGYLMKDKWGKYTGVTETLWYKGISYMWNECAKGEAVDFNGQVYYPYGHSYCSGLTLEIFHRAMKKRDIDLGIPEANENWNGLGTQGIFIFKKIWNVVVIRYSDTNQIVTSSPSPAMALQMSGLGRIITYGEPSKFEDVRRYDFCDISRSTGTGHSVVFIEWIRDPADNHIRGLRYYSSQTSTYGQGYGTEYFEGEGGTVLKSYFRAGRVHDNPADNTPNTIREAGYQ